jgi:hypothetical protein
MVKLKALFERMDVGAEAMVELLNVCICRPGNFGFENEVALMMQELRIQLNHFNAAEHASDMFIKLVLNTGFGIKTQLCKKGLIAAALLQSEIAADAAVIVGNQRNRTENGGNIINEILKKVHASFSGRESAAIIAALVQMIAKARKEFTGTHAAQDDKWLQVWTEKLHEALFVVIIFSDTYRERFTKALLKEANAIKARAKEGKITVYIFDSSKYSPADVFINLETDRSAMGDFKEWDKFTADPKNVSVIGNLIL